MTSPNFKVQPKAIAGRALVSIFAAVLLAAPACAADKTPAKQRSSSAFNPPPSADLNYSIKAKQSGLTLDGEALVQWNNSGNQFTINTETRAMLLGKITEAKSEGGIDTFGLAPLTFIEKRFRRDATTTTFNRDTNTVSFGGSGSSAPIKGGEQDRNSAIWQLISMARSAPSAVKTGSEWTFMVAGASDAEPWTFKVTQQEKIRSRFGDLDTMHIVRNAPPDSKGQQLDIWLAPTQEWYPVKLRFADSNGDFIEQTLEKVSKK